MLVSMVYFMATLRWKRKFLVSKDTLQVKLIDFGCGDLMRKSVYTTVYSM